MPIDVLWLRLPRPTVPLPDTLAYIGTSHTMVVTIPRPDYLQCGVLIPKGDVRGRQGRRAAGVPGADRPTPRRRSPEVVDELTDWDSVKLLTVQIDLLRRWSVPGALCIGDAAHAMSPAFGVGINYAVQDAVADGQRCWCPCCGRHRRTAQRPRRGGPARAAAAATADRDDAAPPGGRRTARSAAVASWSTTRRTGSSALVPGAVLSALRPLTARLIGYGFRPERISDEVLSGKEY